MNNEDVELEFVLENDRIMRHLESEGCVVVREDDKVIIKFGLESGSGFFESNITLTPREAEAVAWFMVSMANPDYHRKMTLLKWIKEQRAKQKSPGAGAPGPS